MKNLYTIASLTTVLAGLLAPGAALAQQADDAGTDDQVIVVTASGTRQPITETGQSISVVGLDELQSVQGPDLSRVLERMPGVALSRNGGVGSTTGLFVRGASTDQVLVLVDGVRVADYTSPGGNYEIGGLLSGNLQSLELLRGSNSVVWGSQAMGGVLSVTTRDLDGAEGAAEYGSNNALYATGAAGLQRDAYGFSLNGGYLHADGFSAKSGGTEADGVRQWQVGGKGRLALADGLTLRATGRYADTLLDVDLAGANAADTQKSKDRSGRVGLDYDGDGLTLSGGVSASAYTRSYDIPSWAPYGSSEYVGSATQADLRGHAELSHGFTADFGADSEWSRARSTYFDRQTARQSSGHLLLGLRTGGLSIAAGARLDDHDRFGSHWTFGANGALALADGWRLRASYGEGFKAPTLYQLYDSYYGNTALKPETSRSYEAGIEYGTTRAPFHAAVTWFQRDSRNLIDLSSFAYANTARARAKGVELELAAKVTPRFTASAAYTWLNARDLTANRALARRPHHTVVLGADWRTPLHDLTLGADLRYVSLAYDYNNYVPATYRLAGHTVATVRASLPVTDRIDLFARVENVGNAQYQTAWGFNSEGRSVHAGARARF